MADLEEWTTPDGEHLRVGARVRVIGSGSSHRGQLVQLVDSPTVGVIAFVSCDHDYEFQIGARMLTPRGAA